MFDKLFFCIMFFFLSFMLIFPSVFTEIKYFLTLLLLFLSLIYVLIKKINIIKKYLISIIIWVTYFTFSLLWGIVNGFYDLNLNLINYYIFTPIIAFIISLYFDSIKKYVSLNKILISITFIITIIDIVFILNQINIIKIPFDLRALGIFGSVRIIDNKLEFRITNQSSLMFLLPYILTIFIEEQNNKKKKVFYFITSLLGIIIAFLSGRRALQLVTLLSIFWIIIFHRVILNKNKEERSNNITKYILIFLLIMLITYLSLLIIQNFLQIDIFKAFLNTFISVFDVSSGGGEKRFLEIKYLFIGWGSSPVIGWGLNSYTRNFIASGTTPWSYEMVYNALLFQTGLIGVLLFFYFIIKIIKNLLQSLIYYYNFSKYFYGVLIGFISFLIAGATNPLVYYLWAWIIVFIPINLNRGEKNERNNISRWKWNKALPYNKINK